MLPLAGFCQWPNFSDHSIGYETEILFNPVELLRNESVVLIKDGRDTVRHLVHDNNLTKAYYQDFFYMPVFGREDTFQVYDPIDRVKIIEDFYEDHKFKNGLLAESYYYSQYVDSSRVDTSKRILYWYDNGKLIKTVTMQYWNQTSILERLYFWSNDNLDSIYDYTNVHPSTFGTKYSDTLRFDKKIRLLIDQNGRVFKKEQFWRSWSQLLVSYEYPNDQTVVIIQTPYNPIRGCFKDNSVTLSLKSTYLIREDGLISKVQSYYRSKNEGEPWELGEPVLYEFEYLKN